MDWLGRTFKKYYPMLSAGPINQRVQAATLESCNIAPHFNRAGYQSVPLHELINTRDMPSDRRACEKIPYVARVRLGVSGKAWESQKLKNIANSI
jgi:hypothetical protein